MSITSALGAFTRTGSSTRPQCSGIWLVYPSRSCLPHAATRAPGVSSRRWPLHTRRNMDSINLRSHSSLAASAANTDLQILPAATSSTSSSASTSTSTRTSSNDMSLADARKHDIITASSADGPVYLEALSEFDDSSGSLLVACKGSRCTLMPGVGSSAALISTGSLLQAADPWIKAYAGWSAMLPAGQIPAGQHLELQDCCRASSLEDLAAEVSANPALWCDGTGPGDAPLQGLAHQLLNAGELLALMQGSRGACMVQLCVGWDAAAPQPVHNPLVLELLKRAAAADGISITLSRAPGGLGLTALLTAAKEPWRSWAAHLASFGAQAALVADSPYYKLLIGRVVGYKEQNIVHHIQQTHGRHQPSAEVVAAVDRDLAKLSHKMPKLPWNVSSRRKKGKGAK